MLTFKKVLEEIQNPTEAKLNATAVKELFKAEIEKVEINIKATEINLAEALSKANIDEFKVKRLELDIERAANAAKINTAANTGCIKSTLAKIAKDCSQTGSYVTEAVEAYLLTTVVPEETPEVRTAVEALNFYKEKMGAQVSNFQKSLEDLQVRKALIQKVMELHLA